MSIFCDSVASLFCLNLFSLLKPLCAQCSYIICLLSILRLFGMHKSLRARRSHIFRLLFIFHAYRCLLIDRADTTEHMAALPTEMSIIGYL